MHTTNEQKIITVYVKELVRTPKGYVAVTVAKKVKDASEGCAACGACHSNECPA